MQQEFVRNPYNYDSDQLSEDTGLECKDESLTEQEHIEEADINYIADKFMRTGEMPQVLQLPTPAEFDGIFDFQTAMNTIAKAKLEFASLPAKIRSRFENDPAQLLEFVNDDNNREEAIRLGFIPKPDTIDTPSTTETTNEPGTTGSTRKTQKTTTGTNRTQRNETTDEGTQKP